MNLSLTVSWSLEHDTLQSSIKASAGDFLKNSLDSENVLGGETNKIMQSYCLVNSEYKFTYENYNFTIPCDVIKKGTDSIVDYEMTYLIDTVYYAEYNCEFWKCVKESSVPFVLVSEKAMDYWRAKFLLLAIISFVLFVLIFLISKNKPITVLVTGILLVISSLPFRSLHWALGFIPTEFSGIFSIFFTRAHSVFIIIFIIGLVFIGIGLVFRLFGWSMNLIKQASEDSGKEGISKSEVRKIVDEEISKENVSKSKKKKK
jgi:hypothetical protein